MSRDDFGRSLRGLWILLHGRPSTGLLFLRISSNLPLGLFALYSGVGHFFMHGSYYWLPEAMYGVLASLVFAGGSLFDSWDDLTAGIAIALGFSAVLAGLIDCVAVSLRSPTRKPGITRDGQRDRPQ